MTRHLDLLQQYGGTNGYCHLWALAIRELLPHGRIVALMATDPRTLEKHDWPEGEPLSLHQFILLPDGGAVDVQGLHSMQEMLGKFGIRRGYLHHLLDLPEERTRISRVEVSRPEWAKTARLYLSVLEELGWNEELPRYDGELERKWKSVSEEALRNGVPDPVLSSAAVDSRPARS